VLQAITNQTVDIVLAMLLILGSVVGTPVGTRLATRLPGFGLRGALAVTILGVATELVFELLAPPHSLYTLGEILR